jgi:hypothetical protein
MLRIGSLALTATLLFSLAQAQPIPAPREGQTPEFRGGSERGPAIERRAPEQSETGGEPTEQGATPEDAQGDTDPCAGDAACYQRRDLQAQEDMAEAAFWMTLATWVQVVVAVVGTIIAILLLRSLRYSPEANALNRNALIAANRAWIKVTRIRITSPLSWSKNESGLDIARISIEFSVQNIGESPAFQIWHDVNAYLGFFAPDEGFRRYIIMAAKAIESRPQPGIGSTLFPNDTFDQSYELAVDWEERARTNQRGEAKEIPPAVLMFVGCITYRLMFEKEIRQTGFALPLMDLDETRRARPLGPERGQVPAGNLQMVWGGVSENTFAT